MNPETGIPYCGPAPLPEALWSRWNADPWLAAALLALGLLWMVTGRRDRAGSAAFGTALLLALVIFISPLCALASALFSARVAHHLILIAGIAPLLAVALPWRSGPASRTVWPLTPLVLLHTALVWLWHAPAPYALALSSDTTYWVMQLSLLSSAWLLWNGVLASRTGDAAAAAALLATITQMGLLGALLVFLPRAVFEPHFLTTLPYSLTALEDQQLAGVLMWVPAALPYLGVALLRVSRLLTTPARATP